MSNRTFQYFCNRERLLLLKEVSEEEDRETYEKMKKARQWDRNELFDMVYHACVFLDDTQAQKAYSILFDNNWVGDMTLNDTVIFTCISNNDIVSCFCWIFKYHNNDFNKIRLAIGATLAAFKGHRHLENIYRNFLEYLKSDWLPKEADSDSTEISEALCLMLHRLRSCEDINEFITSYGKKLKTTPLATLWWLQDVFKSEYAHKHIDSKGGLGQLLVEIKGKWDYLAECCVTDPNILEQAGRWAFVLKWYIKYRENPVMKKYGQFFVANSIFRNKHIDEIKEILTVDVDSPFAWMYIDEVSMYMSPSKMERIFHISEHKRAEATWCLTCADNMNDDNEGVVLYKYLKSLGVNWLDDVVHNFGIGSNNERSSVFLGSYSMSFNDSYLYDLYSKKGSNEKGYCVEVDLRSFDNTIEDGLNNDEYGWMCPLYYVVYADRLSDIADDRIAQHIKDISNLLQKISLFLGECTENEMLNDIKTVVFKELEEIAYLFKSKGGYDEDHIWRDWTKERELRTVKCVRGESNSIVTSKTNTSKNGLYYRNYVTKKRIIVKNVAGGNSIEDLEEVKRELLL